MAANRPTKYAPSALLGLSKATLVDLVWLLAERPSDDGVDARIGRMEAVAASIQAPSADRKKLAGLRSPRSIALAPGWHIAASFAQHSVLLEINPDGSPRAVRTTLADLELAIDKAAEYFGEPLEITGTWRTDDGEPVDGSKHLDRNCRVTCEVERAAPEPIS